MKLYNKINKIKNSVFNNVSIATNSTLFILDNTIELEINGTPSNILITYSGAGTFLDKTPIDIKVKISKSSILITNVFKKQIPNIILEYSGDITINSCQIMNFNGSKIRSTINNNQNELLLNKAKTNMEDDTLILYDEPKIKVNRSSGKSGLIKPNISRNAINEFGEVQKYGKIEKETLVNVIREFAPRVQKDAKYKPLKEVKQQITKPIAKPNKPKEQKNIKYEGGKK
tara:strand:+ start:95 stop:781 length:687 start_codon:yes stop_codon:yes gene_type:complete